MKQSYSQSPRGCFPVIFLLPPFCFFFEFKKNLINECISQSVLSLCCCAWAFSSCGEQGRLFSCSTQASYCGGFTRGAQALGPEGFCSCGLWAQQLWLADSRALAQLHLSMWGLPIPGIKPVLPAQAGGFLSTVPPGKFISLLHFCCFPLGGGNRPYNPQSLLQGSSCIPKDK